MFAHVLTLSKKLIKTLLILEKMEQEHAKTLLLEKNNLEQECFLLEKEKTITQDHMLQERSYDGDASSFVTFPDFEKALLDKIKEIKHQMDNKNHELVYVQQDLFDVYRTLKGWEVLRQRLEEQQRHDDLKNDQALLDEVGQQRYKKIT